VKRTCKCFYKIDNEVIIEKNISHNHEPDNENILTRQSVSNSLKRKVQLRACKRPSKLVHSDLQNDIETLTHFDFNLITKNMHYARKSVQPSIPKDSCDIHRTLNGFKIKTNREEVFLLTNDSVDNMIIFTTNDNLKCCCKKLVRFTWTGHLKVVVKCSLFMLHTQRPL